MREGAAPLVSPQESRAELLVTETVSFFGTDSGAGAAKLGVM